MIQAFEPPTTISIELVVKSPPRATETPPSVQPLAPVVDQSSATETPQNASERSQTETERIEVQVDDEDYDKVDLVSESGSEDDNAAVVDRLPLDKGKAREIERAESRESPTPTKHSIDTFESFVASPRSHDAKSLSATKEDAPPVSADPEDVPLDDTAASSQHAADPPCDTLPESTTPSADRPPFIPLAELLSSLLPPNTATALSSFFASPSPAVLEQLVREATENIPAVVARAVETARTEVGRVAEHVRTEADSVRAEFERAKHEVETVRREFEEEVKRAAAEIGRQAAQSGQRSATFARPEAQSSQHTTADRASSSPSAPESSAIPSHSPRDPLPPRNVSETEVHSRSGMSTTASAAPSLRAAATDTREYNTREDYPPFHVPGAFHDPQFQPSASSSRLNKTPASVKELKQAVKELGFNPDKSLGVRIACERVWDRHRGDSLETMTAAVVSILCE